MKKISKILAILLSSATIVYTTSCDSYLDVNNNVDAPDHVEAELYLPGICAAFQGVYYEIRGMGPLTQMMGTSGYTSFATHYYSQNSDACAEIWRLTYWLHGKNLENMINQSIEKKQYAFAGIGMAIKAFDWDMLVKEHGEVPFKQAYEDERLSHDYDYQKDIYPEIRKMARKAIEYIEMDEANMDKYGSLISSADYIYHGDMAKWKKFAYAVLVRNYISMSCKNDFVSAGYADSVIDCASKSFASIDDDATVEVAADGETNSSYTNFWGPLRYNLSNSYWQHDYAVQIMSGTVPKYDESTGDKVRASVDEYTANWYPYELNPNQIICDTVRTQLGHFDPRITVLCATTAKRYAAYTITDSVDLITATPNGTDYIYDTVRKPMTDVYTNEHDYILNYVAKRYYGSGFIGSGGPIGTAPSFYGRVASGDPAKDGYGRWLYRDGAPYILSTFAELNFNVAEAYWKKGDKASALQAFKDGVTAHMGFCAKYIVLPTADLGGDKITKATFVNFANEYLAGPYVNGLTVSDFTLSHIMMQKWMALYPWGAAEAFVDLRKYHWDIKYTGDYPKLGNGWTENQIDQKWDTDPTKVYKGFYLLPAQVQNRKSAFNTYNQGSPCYRIRPRYNSEYMWNMPSLQALKPIAGDAANYQCSIPWFAFPGDVPSSL